MSDPENHPLTQIALQELLEQSIKFVKGKIVDRGTVETVKEIAREHRDRWRKKGLDFPPLVLFIVPRLKIYRFWNANWDVESIKISIVNLVRSRPEVTMAEVVQGIRWCYPWIKPGDLLMNNIFIHQAEQDTTASETLRQALKRMQ
jgi:hypothetical protein